jgi:Uma2 family endonuclease
MGMAKMREAEHQQFSDLERSTMVVPTTSQATDSIVVLSDVDWTTYERLRALDANRNVRMTFDRGVLVLMSPSKLHERIAELLAQMILVWTEEFDVRRQSAGSTTMKRELLKRGFEPDKAFYLEHEPQVRNRDDFEPGIDPPPDLAIEVDVTALSTSRFAIYAEFGVPEIWRWYDGRILVYRLQSGDYIPVDASVSLPGFPLAEADQVLLCRLNQDETTLIREFREVVQRMKKGSTASRQLP